MKPDFDIWRGNIGLGLLCPFDKADALCTEIFIETCFKKFICMSETIKIKVIQHNSRNCINFDQGVGRAFYTPPVPRSAQQAAGQRGFARAKISAEPDRQARCQQGYECGAKCFRGCGIRKLLFQRAGMIAGVMHSTSSPLDTFGLLQDIRNWSREFGFAAIGVAGVDLSSAEQGLLDWLAAGFHGGMDYMARHGLKRARPAELVPGTLSVISVRMDYWPEPDLRQALALQADGTRAAVSRYALGRDYHKVLRTRLQSLADRIGERVGEFGHRVFVDSAPVLEVELASRAGLGWRGKHTLLISREAGSFFFLGELFLDFALPADEPVKPHCGTCSACIPACPTQAIIAPYRLDARRCISYLTIEHAGSIPEALRPLIGNRVYGCDDCQLACPWNRFAQQTAEPDFAVRNGLDQASLIELFAWSEEIFKQRLAGSPIYRIGHERWLRNLAVGLGNAPGSPEVISALQARAQDSSALVREHVAWALARHAVKTVGT